MINKKKNCAHTFFDFYSGWFITSTTDIFSLALVDTNPFLHFFIWLQCFLFLSFIYSSIHLFISIYLSNPTIYSYIYLIHPSLHLSIYLIHPSIYLSIYLIHPTIHPFSPNFSDKVERESWIPPDSDQSESRDFQII